jgi:ubiquinone biosynthesis accessory factor UbiJ
MTATDSHPDGPNWRRPAGRALEAALNRALALDRDTRDALVALDGRSVDLQLESPPLALRLTVAGARLEVGPTGGDAPDLGLRTTLAGLLSQLPFLRSDDAPPVGRMQMSGDSDLARRLQRLAGRFDPDWQLPFVAVLGEMVGVQVARAFATALRQAREAGAALAQTTAEYLTEESRDLVPRAELEVFHDDVDALRDDVERLAARIARLPSGAGW